MNSLKRSFTDIAIDFPEKEIFYRLGGNRFKTRLAPDVASAYLNHCRKAFSLVSPQGRYGVARIIGTFPEGVELASGKLWLGKDFSSQGSSAAYLWYGCVTIGRELTESRDRQSDAGTGAIYDAVGSECADSAMDTLFRLAHKELLRQGLILNERRFSPGYGDMKLELQHFFYEQLDMAEMGVSLTGNFYLMPEKSVTAFAFATTIQGN